MKNRAQVSFLQTTSGIELNYMSDELGLYNRVFEGFMSAATTAHELGFLTKVEAEYVLAGEFQLFRWNKRVGPRDKEWLEDKGFQYVGKWL